MEAINQFLEYVDLHSQSIAGIIDDIKDSVKQGEISSEIKERISNAPVPPESAKFQNWDSLQKDLMTNKFLIEEGDYWGSHYARLTDDVKGVLIHFNTIATSINGGTLEDTLLANTLLHPDNLLQSISSELSTKELVRHILHIDYTPKTGFYHVSADEIDYQQIVDQVSQILISHADIVIVLLNSKAFQYAYSVYRECWRFFVYLDSLALEKGCERDLYNRCYSFGWAPLVWSIHISELQEIRGWSEERAIQITKGFSLLSTHSRFGKQTYCFEFMVPIDELNDFMLAAVDGQIHNGSLFRKHLFIPHSANFRQKAIEGLKDKNDYWIIQSEELLRCCLPPMLPAVLFSDDIKEMLAVYLGILSSISLRYADICIFAYSFTGEELEAFMQEKEWREGETDEYWLDSEYKRWLGKSAKAIRKSACDRCDKKNCPFRIGDLEKRPLPAKLDSKEAHFYWKRAQDAGWVDKDYSFLKEKKKELTYFAAKFSEALFNKIDWTVFMEWTPYPNYANTYYEINNMPVEKFKETKEAIDAIFSVKPDNT